MKKIYSVLFLISISIIGFCICITNVKAYGYGLWVNGEEFGSDKSTINCGSGTATFNYSSKTLTLNNASINKVYTGTDYDTTFTSSIYYEGSDKLNINLIGYNSIYSQISSNLYEAISVREGSTSISGSGSIHINTGKITYDDIIEVGINSYGSLTIDGSTVQINLAASSLYSDDFSIGMSSDSGIIIKGTPNISIIADLGFYSSNGNIDQTISIYNGSLTSSTRYDAFYGKVMLDNFSGKIMAGFSEDGTNADLYSKAEFLELIKNYYIHYVKFGAFDTYRIYNTSGIPNLITPSEAFYGEPIEVIGGYNDSGTVNVYKIKSVSITDTNGEDVMDTINYDSSTRRFTMPNYPIMIDVEYVKNFKVAPKTLTPKLYGYNDVKLSWASAGTEGYYVYYKKSTASTYSYLGKTKNNSFKKANLASGTKYYFKIVPYAEVNGNIIKSSSYKTTSIYTLKKMKAPTITKKNSTSVKVKWNKINGTTGYEIYKSTSKTKNFKLLKRVNNSYSSYSFKATRNKKYYYKIRAYKLVDGKRIYAPFSNVKAFTLR